MGTRAVVTMRTNGRPARHRVVSRARWLRARIALLRREKLHTRQGDRLARLRRALPWVRVTTPYVFDGPGGRVRLADLFAGRRQLVVYHFMFHPEDGAGCPHCSFWADHFDATRPHLRRRDTALAVVSRAPVEKLLRFRRRMGWTFPWVSSGRSSFNFDFGASFRPAELAAGPVTYNFRRERMDMEDREGVSVFFKDRDGAIYHTYSAFARGIEVLNTTYDFLDLTPKGRDEGGLEFTQAWVRHKDRYPR